MLIKSTSRNYRVGISFSKDEQTYVEAVAKILAHHLGKGAIFFAPWQSGLCPGPHFNTKLDDIYSKQCDLVVVFFSESYFEKTITKREVSAAVSQSKRPSWFFDMLYFSFGDVQDLLAQNSFEGVAQDLNDTDHEAAAQCILERLNRMKEQRLQTKGIQTRVAIGIIAIIAIFFIFKVLAENAALREQLVISKSLPFEKEGNEIEMATKQWDHPLIAPFSPSKASPDRQNELP